MFTLVLATSPWALERAPRHACAMGGVYLSVCQSKRAFPGTEIDMR